MSNSTIRLGFDRFIPLQWANAALDLRMAGKPLEESRKDIRNWIGGEVAGTQTAIKTSNQVCKLWLTENDPGQPLREMALERVLVEDQMNRRLLHFGLAINVFPLFRSTCQAAGRLINLQSDCTRQEIRGRVIEKYGNPASIHTSVDRVIQTLVDWGLLRFEDKKFVATVIRVSDGGLIEWILLSLLISQPDRRMPLTDLLISPELLGVQMHDYRSAIYKSKVIFTESSIGHESIIAREID